MVWREFSVLVKIFKTPQNFQSFKSLSLNVLLVSKEWTVYDNFVPDLEQPVTWNRSG